MTLLEMVNHEMTSTLGTFGSIFRRSKFETLTFYWVKKTSRHADSFIFICPDFEASLSDVFSLHFDTVEAEEI